MTLGTVGILTLLVVQLGKYAFPSAFRSDTNVSWSVAFAIVFQALYTYMTGGSMLDMWNSVPVGATTGYAVSGIYRQISSMSKTNSVDMTEQVHETILTTPAELRELVKSNGEEDEDKPKIGFTSK